jgi:2'-5' RNA ligase
MRYMIAHIIGGDARKYHEQLSRVLASSYALRPVTASIDPHLTIKAPFEALSTDIEQVEHIIEAYARYADPVPYTLTGFGKFDDRVIYMNVEAGSDAFELIQKCKDELRQVPWLEFKPHEREVVLHATLCYPKDAAQAHEILSRLTQHMSPTFSCTLGSISLLKKGGRRWEVVKEYPLGGNERGVTTSDDHDLISGTLVV